MPNLMYSGHYYYDGKNRFTEPGEYEVDDAKANQLLTDFPEQFEALEGTHKPAEGSTPTKSLSKMNRAELETLASDIGLIATDALDTNGKLREAIKTHQDKGSDKRETQKEEK